ncbi:MAG: hypothetical protein E6J88_00695 [Deltaproteobacteria bacterium]|nr:MAG: hypothetical protein E6J88_00695 [Deltaproteobacteria bacterium]
MAMISAALSALLAAQPLSASVPPAVRADGRTTAPVVLSFGVEPEEGEKFADQGAIACAGAPTIPAEPRSSTTARASSRWSPKRAK